MRLSTALENMDELFYLRRRFLNRLLFERLTGTRGYAILLRKLKRAIVFTILTLLADSDGRNAWIIQVFYDLCHKSVESFLLSLLWRLDFGTHLRENRMFNADQRTDDLFQAIAKPHTRPITDCSRLTVSRFNSFLNDAQNGRDPLFG